MASGEPMLPGMAEIGADSAETRPGLDQAKLDGFAESSDMDQLIEKLIADPDDPRTETHQFENGYTAYGELEAEQSARATEITARCLERRCTPDMTAHIINCPAKEDFA